MPEPGPGTDWMGTADYFAATRAGPLNTCLACQARCFAAGGGGLVDDLAHRLAAELGLEFFPAVEKIRETRPQKMMQNSTRQARNLLGAFRVKSVRSGPVLLVDDVVDSRWTLTVVGDLLGAAGSGPVYPVALTDTSRRDS